MIQTKYISIVAAFLVVVFTSCVIFKQIEEYQMQKDPMLDKIREQINPLFSEKYGREAPREIERLIANRPNLLDEIRFYRGNKSYTINKQKVFLCLKDENDEYYNLNLLVYVTLHELAHVLCDEIGHTAKFDRIFQDLLAKADEMSVYDSKGYIDPNYCMYSDEE